MIAKTFYGLEEVLAEEIINLGGDDVEIGRRAVFFKGDKKMMYKANLHLRTALRVLKPIKAFKAKNADEIYETLRKFDWEEYMDVKQTFTVDTVLFSDIFKNSQYLTYRVKDAIADSFNAKYGKRPSVRLVNPDIYVHLHISNDMCTLCMDSSGESLHKRGYRVDQTEAPLNEVLAAGMLLLAGWKGQTNFIDPMCGSGTLPIEAALIALNIPAGIYRQRFAFQSWKDYDADLFDELYDEDTQRPFEHKIYGSDISRQAIAIASKNVESAGLTKYIHLKAKAVQDIVTTVGNEGLLMTNPPYGERIKPADLMGLYKDLGERLKHVFAGYQAWVLSYRKECFDNIGLRHSKRVHLMNGALECEMRLYEIFSGKMDGYKMRKAHGKEK
ncbi:MAG: RNA methyltransferase [Bacteroidales bacterium]|nr:RNA methyltransferase [Bacteroidales bacterium]MBO5718079.1 RNA methyltransferase [Bacteroidales bacterium]MBO5769354.1 RNA methyltransferase [Bacteroidales bacterium]MBO5818449.1 RNA methyltransferase [Bacteroidales bacterium]MBO5835808.1 RNA methyltransferase [Bacteroidales bacterium]